jgi:hypothetical protein
MGSTYDAVSGEYLVEDSGSDIIEPPLPSPTQQAAVQRTLFNLSGEMLFLDALLAEHEGDMSHPEVQEAFDAWFQSGQGALEDKLEAYIHLIRENEGRAMVLDVEAGRIGALADTHHNKATALKNRLRQFMETHERSKIETRTGVISLVNNGGSAPVKLRVDNITDLPEKYLRTKVEVDTAALRAAIVKEGPDFPYAELSERGKHIRLK